MKRILTHGLLTMAFLLTGLRPLAGPTTAFTYQGQLNNGGNPANGSFDLTFALYGDPAAGPIVGVLTNGTVAVTNGLFTTVLDFGPGIFTGANYWLEIAVRTNGDTTFTTLAPRQQIMPAPYSIYAATAGSAATSLTAGSVAAANIIGPLPPGLLPATLLSNNQSGVVLNGVFGGDGGGLTNLTAASLTGTLDDAQLGTNVARLSIPNTTVTAAATVVVTSGFITGATLVNGGSGYTAAPTVTVADTTGSNAVVTATVVSGVVTVLDVQNPGGHYSVGATITIAPPPSNAIQTFTSGNVFSGVNTFTNAGNTFAGTFSGNASGLTNVSVNAANITGDGTLPAGVLPANVALLNATETFTGSVSFNPTSGGVVIGSSGSTTEMLEVDGYDTTTIRIRNLHDVPGGFIGETYQALQLGMYNSSASSWGVVPAGAKRSFFGVDSGGNVGSLANNFGSPVYRNLLDDGGGNMSVSGNLKLPATTPTTGIIYSGGNTLIHAAGNQNLFAGAGAGNLTLSGNRNTGVGFNALNKNKNGNYNTAIGNYALRSNTNGTWNTAIGDYALFSNTSGNYNSAIGQSALANNISGTANTANGWYALGNNTTGDHNTANGYASLHENTTGSYNVADGVNALYANTTGSFNTANGVTTLYLNTTGSYNTANGAGALKNNTTASYNTADGEDALYSNTSGNNNTANGNASLYSNTTGHENTASGANALLSNTTGYQNAAIGEESLHNNTTGYYNTAAGWAALYSNTTGIANLANGSEALKSNTTGVGNAASGFHALINNSTGSYNFASAYDALALNTTGSSNTASGFRALFNNTTGAYNIGLGNYAGYNLTTGDNNIDIGNQGAAGEGGVIRLGTPGTHTTAYIAGVITGDGSGLTNLNVGQLGGALPLAQLPTGVLTNNGSGVTLNGTFGGNGAGLTNLSADAVLGGLTTNLLVLVPGGGTNTLAFVNGILRSIQ